MLGELLHISALECSTKPNRFANRSLHLPVPVAVVVADAGRDSGGAEIEDEDSVFVDVGVVETDGLRQVDAVFEGQAVGADHF